jgi:deoxyribodipyrimidine photo-lyase
MTTLLWFRRDLRLRDFPPLRQAASDGEDVLACFVLDPLLLKSAGPRRLQFICDSLRGLRDGLDGRLFVTSGAPEKRIPAIAKEIDASAVYASEDFTPYGRRRDDSVRTALGDVPLRTTGSPYLVSPGRVTKDDGSPYKVFTAFFRR